MTQKIAYEVHPVSPERKKELRAQGFKILDARFDPSPKAEKTEKKSEQKDNKKVD